MQTLLSTDTAKLLEHTSQLTYCVNYVCIRGFSIVCVVLCSPRFVVCHIILNMYLYNNRVCCKVKAIG